MRSGKLVGVLLASLAPILWATNVVASRVIVTKGLHPFVLTAIRWLIAGMLLYAYSYTKFGVVRLTRHIFIAGLLGITLFSDLLYAALFFAPAALVGLIIGLVPAVTLILAWVFGIERLDSLLWLAGLLGFAGVALIEYESIVGGLGSSVWLGALLALASVFAWALYTFESKKLVAKAYPLAFLAVSTLSVAPVNFFIALPFLSSSLGALGDPLVVLLILYVAVVPGFIAYLVWLTAVRVLGASATNIYVNLLPLAALVLSIVLLGERLTTLQAVGAALILMSAFLAAVREARLVQVAQQLQKSRRLTGTGQ
ncbi:protein of unknown function DUF6 transmembrane [Pyrolobus fumarii 1A]|uniref:EamA domain-containing protein n=1 Tax=Pyrolobus fumarii (strain DSM 11204 / 1A) TaxID=694429 RepID=G0ECH5_PYRF1|nr:DMT family transporter [Pyrolobus fumarii]AEM39545.1 protein of unknown function DUF6 transmembrane [Pyrolobus fumarii 1A]